MTFLPDKVLAELDLERWPRRTGQLEGVLDLLLIEAESAARRLREIGQIDFADRLTDRCERARTVLNKDPLS